MTKFRIAIIGAGPAGCTLARLLIHKNVDINITIFEGEKGLDARTQGGTLDLHTESGIKALQECGLYDEFIKLARFDGEAFRVTNQYLQSFIHFGGTRDAKSTRGRPEIDRIQLRQLLLDSLPEGLIRWDHKLESIDQNKDDQYTINFKNRPSETDFDLIVGGDGCWSRVRKLLTDELPFYSGISGLAFQISNPTERCPELAKLVDRGSLFAFGNHKGVMAQQLGAGSNGNLSVAYWAVKDESWHKQFSDTDDIESMKKACLDDLDGFDPQLRSFVELADTNATPRNLYMLPVGNSWEHRQGITLLGDAAHVMTPFAGEGVNLAMTDAMRLASAIEKAASSGTRDTLDIEVAAYEQDMFKRAKVVQQQTYNMMNYTLLEPGGLQRNIEMYITSAAVDEVPWLVMPLFKLAVRAYFAWWRWRNPLPRE